LEVVVTDYLLDTHACLFALAAPKKLGKKARRVLEQANTEGGVVWVPAAATAEIVLLREFGRTEIGAPELARAFAETAWRFLPLDFAQIDEFSALAAVRDPFDRLIIAAARCRQAKLISRDGPLAEFGLVDVVWG
jgi:PIN domain nuclease of toxin-antitoxin system